MATEDQQPARVRRYRSVFSRQRFGRRLLAFAALAIAAASVVPAAGTEVLARAEALLNAGDSQAALGLLLPEEVDFAGNPDYDYLLGLALLESGDPPRATLALERALTVNPDFHAARMELGRAYFAMRRYADARSEFERLADSGPPPAAQAAIDSYLRRIGRRTALLRWDHGFSVRARGGYDTNANSATGLNEFLGFDLDANSREQASAFIEYGVGGSAGYALRPDLKLSGSLGVWRRENPDASFVDSTTGVGRLALVQQRDGKRRSLSLNLFQLGIEEDTNSHGIALEGDWTMPWRPRDWRWSLFGRAGVLRYGDALEVKDVDQYVLGVSAQRGFGANDRAFLASRLWFGRDEATRPESRYDRDIYGLEVSTVWHFSDKLRGRLRGSVLQGDYDAVFFAQTFDEARSDRSFRFAVSLDWRLSGGWVLTPLLAYTNNDTDVSIYDYDRLESSLAIRHIWR